MNYNYTFNLPEQRRLLISAFMSLYQDPLTIKVTTLELKNYLRTKEPTYGWYQELVSDLMKDIYESSEIPYLQFEDTGMYREYFLDMPAQPKVAAPNLPAAYNPPTTAKTPKIYSLTVGQKTYIGDYTTMTVIIEMNELAVYYSKSKDSFILIEDMADEHIANVILKSISSVPKSDPKALVEFLEGNLVSELLSRY